MCPEEHSGLQLVLGSSVCVSPRPGPRSILLLRRNVFTTQPSFALRNVMFALERLPVQCEEWDGLCSGTIGQVLRKAYE